MRVIIFFGGKSVEHDISIITALQVMKNLPDGIEFVPIYMSRDGKFWHAENLNDIKVYTDFEKNAKNLKQVTFLLGEKTILVKKGRKFVFWKDFDATLNCCHGRVGEDGCLQGLLNMCEVPQTTSQVTSMALCMDKAFFKDVCKANGIETTPYFVIKSLDELKSHKKIEFPCIVKPANLGSSIAISVCENTKELMSAVELAFQFDNKVLVEKLVENLKEFNCACFEYKGELFVSHVAEVKNDGQMYSFEDKYISTATQNQDADKNFARKVQNLTEKVYRLFDCKGVVRVDFLFDTSTKTLFVNEVNSIPGSMAFYLFKDIPFKEILLGLIKQSMLDFNAQKALIRTFSSDALNVFANVEHSLKK